MALQPDQEHEADDSDQLLCLPDLIIPEFPEVPGFQAPSDVPPEVRLYTPHEYGRNDFANVPGPSQPWEPQGLHTQHLPQPRFIDPRLLHASSQVQSVASDSGDRSIVTTAARSSFASTRPQFAAGSIHPQGLPGGDVPGASRPALSDEPPPQNAVSKWRRSCLKCRFEQKNCPHRPEPNAELQPDFINQYDMLFLELENLMNSTKALYTSVIALELNTAGYLPSDGGPISLHMVLELEDTSSLAVLRNQHEVVFLPDWLRVMLQMDTHTYSTFMEPAIYVIGFDDFISKQMWPGHEQQPQTRFTQAQEIILQTARLFCGYLTLLANLDHIEIYTEYTEQYTARLICVALVYLFTHRLYQLYRDMGRNLQALVAKEDSNHYFAARTLELMYTCLRISSPFDWSTTNYPISRQLDRIRVLLNERIPIIWQEIQNIERDFASPKRGDGRLKEDPTMKAADTLRFKNLQIYFGWNRLSQLSTNMMLTWDGRLNMYSIPELLSSQPPTNADQPNLPSVNPGLPFDNGDGTLTAQALQALGSYAHVTHLQPQSTHTNAATRPSTNTDADPANGLSPSEFLTWNLDAENRDWWLEGGTSNQLPNGFPNEFM